MSETIRNFADVRKSMKNPDSSPASKYLGEELPGLRCKDTKSYGTDQTIFGKVLSVGICLVWMARVEEIHAEILNVIGWMNRDLPEWVMAQERFGEVCTEIRRRMGW